MTKLIKFAVLCFLSALLAACGGSSSSDAQSPASGQPTALVVTDTVVGTGATAAVGNTLTVHYTGWLYSATAPNNLGVKFESSLTSGTPFSFVLGAGQVIPGWDQGLVGMKVGGKRMLTIPSHLAYGQFGAGSKIPPNAALVFEVELVSIK